MHERRYELVSSLSSVPSERKRKTWCKDEVVGGGRRANWTWLGLKSTSQELASRFRCTKQHTMILGTTADSIRQEIKR